MPLTEKKKQSNKRSQDKNNKRFSIIMNKCEGKILEKYLKNNWVHSTSYKRKNRKGHWQKL